MGGETRKGNDERKKGELRERREGGKAGEIYGDGEEEWKRSVPSK